MAAFDLARFIDRAFGRTPVLTLSDDAARPHWRSLGARYLAPQGQPTNAREGDPANLRALYDSASEFANGFAITPDAAEHSSSWVTENQARLMIRSMRWLGRRLALGEKLPRALPVRDPARAAGREPMT